MDRAALPRRRGVDGAAQPGIEGVDKAALLGIGDKDGAALPGKEGVDRAALLKRRKNIMSKPLTISIAGGSDCLSNKEIHSCSPKTITDIGKSDCIEPSIPKYRVEIQFANDFFGVGLIKIMTSLLPVSLEWSK